MGKIGCLMAVSLWPVMPIVLWAVPRVYLEPLAPNLASPLPQVFFASVLVGLIWGRHFQTRAIQCLCLTLFPAFWLVFWHYSRLNSMPFANAFPFGHFFSTWMFLTTLLMAGSVVFDGSVFKLVWRAVQGLILLFVRRPIEKEIQGTSREGRR